MESSRIYGEEEDENMAWKEEQKKKKKNEEEKRSGCEVWRLEEIEEEDAEP